MFQTKAQSAKLIRAGLDKNHNNFYEESKRKSALSPRIPEIQMINKFYGLIPKKFAINERVQPTVSLLRQKNFSRPKTARPLRSSSPSSNINSGITNKSTPQLRRYSSLDNSQIVDTPLLTKRISFEKVNAKQVKKLEQKVEQNKDNIPENLFKNHRILKIDLNQIRKDEDQPNSEDVGVLAKEGYTSDSDAEDANSNLVSKTIAHSEPNDEDADNAEAQSENAKTARPNTAAPRMFSNNNLSRIQGQEINFTSDILKPINNGPHWTIGKSTAERRSKLQKSISIHPSFNFSSLDGAEESEPHSELSSYPSSMTRTGRRALHVEELPEVDTLVANFGKKRTKSKSLDESQSVDIYTSLSQHNQHRLIRRDSQHEIGTNVVYSRVIEHVPIIRKPYGNGIHNSNEVSSHFLNYDKSISMLQQKMTTSNNNLNIKSGTSLQQQAVLNSSKQKQANISEIKTRPILKKSNSITAVEKRKLFSKKSVSLPSLSHESHGKRSDQKKSHQHNHSNRPSSTIPHVKSDKKVSDKIKIKETNLTDHAKKVVNASNNHKSMSNRPKTAPSPKSNMKNSSNKGSQDEVNWRHKKTNGQEQSPSTGSRILIPVVPITKKEHSDSIPNQKPLTINQEQNLRPIRLKSSYNKVSQGVKFSEEYFEKSSSKEKKVDTVDNKGETKVSNEMEAEQALAPEKMKIVPRRSFSLDEASLLTYSTSIAESIDSIETSLQNSKKREECLKIYEKMLKQGSPIRLQTIFRGMMTPSEYRTFIGAAEKAARNSVDNIVLDNVPENPSSTSQTLSASTKGPDKV